MSQLIFMGTSDFACRCLDSLERDNINMKMIITRPDSISGRERRPSYPPVKRWALCRGTEVWQPRNINSPDSVSRLRALAPDLFIVVAYGKILSKEVLSLPALGSINVHASLLPDLRGAAPIERSIMLGYTKTGITVMYMDEGLDTGDIILQEQTEIGKAENAGELRERLAVMAQGLLPKAVRLILAGQAPRSPQPIDCMHFAPVLDSGVERIDWTRPAQEVANLVRALAPTPGCYCIFRGKRLKILEAAAVTGNALPGEAVLAAQKLRLGTGAGLLELASVQPEGKKVLSVREFVNGYRIQEGELFL